MKCRLRRKAEQALFDLHHRIVLRTTGKNLSHWVPFRDTQNCHPEHRRRALTRTGTEEPGTLLHAIHRSKEMIRMCSDHRDLRRRSPWRERCACCRRTGFHRANHRVQRHRWRDPHSQEPEGLICSCTGWPPVPERGVRCSPATTGHARAAHINPWPPRLPRDQQSRSQSGGSRARCLWSSRRAA
jgi:hypothetical protein